MRVRHRARVGAARDARTAAMSRCGRPPPAGLGEDVEHLVLVQQVRPRVLDELRAVGSEAAGEAGGRVGAEEGYLG